MSKEGYLILCGDQDNGNENEVYYFVLGDGYLRYYTKRFGLLIGELNLSGCRLKVWGVPDSDKKTIPFSFKLRLQRVIMKKGNQFKLESPTEMTLGTASKTQKAAWGNAIYSWQRHYWKDPVLFDSKFTPEEIENQFEKQRMELDNIVESTKHRTKRSSSFLRRNSSTDSSILKVLKPAAISINIPQTFNLSQCFQQSAY